MQKRPNARFNRLSTYVAIGFCAMAVFLTLLLSEVTGYLAVGKVKDSIGEGLAELAFQAADKLDRGMFERYRETQLLASRPELADLQLAPARKRALLEALQASYPYYAWIGLADLQGKVVAASGGLLEGADVSRRPWFQRAQEKVFVGDVHDALLLAKLLPPGPAASPDEPIRFVDVAAPVHDAQGRSLGVLGAHLSWNWAREVEQSMPKSIAGKRRVETLILSEQGKVLLGPAALRDQVLSEELRTTLQTAVRGTALVTWPDGHQTLAGFARADGYASYPGLGWTVVVRQDLTEAYAPVRDLQARIVWLGAVLAAFFSLLGLVAARLITRPVRALAQAARRIESGDAHSLETPVGTYAEAQALGDALRALLAKLRQKEGDLQSLNAELESRIAARTAELRKALADVRANQQRIETILETAQDAFIGIDLQGNVTDWNGAAEKLLGWRRSEALGRPLDAMIIPARFAENYHRALRAVRATRDAALLPERVERRVLTADRREIPVEMTIGLVQVNGAWFFSVFLHDISQRRQVELMKDELIATVSHELRAPLDDLHASLDMLRASLPQTTANRHLIDAADRAHRHLASLVGDMLDIERIESGRLLLDLAVQPLQPLLEAALESVRGQAAHKEVAFALQVDASAGPVEVDGARIVQVMVNLLANAVEHSPACTSVQVRLETLADGLRLSVRDEGEGIPLELHARIFEKFGVVEKPSQRRHGGTGLGLAISKRIIEAHGGSIGFRSSRGAGAEFFFVLPHAPAPAAA